MTTTMPSVLDLIAGRDFSDVLAQLKPEYDAIPEDELVTANLDVGQAANVALWAAVQMEPMRTALEAQFPGKAALLDKLVPAAQAALQSQFDYTAATTPPAAIPELEAKVSRYRTIFLADLQALARRGLIADSDIPDVGTPNSFKNLAYEVGAMISLIRSRWAELQTRTAITEAELDDAQETTQRLAFVVVTREFGPAAVSRASAVRQRIFTLLSKIYDELVRCFTYLRWYERDLEKFTPSLYKAQRTRSDKRDSQPQQSESAPVAPAGGSVASPTNGATTTAGAKRIPDGLPGSSPTD
jgi:hypothetical protein